MQISKYSSQTGWKIACVSSFNTLKLWLLKTDEIESSDESLSSCNTCLNICPHWSASATPCQTLAPHIMLCHMTGPLITTKLRFRCPQQNALHLYFCHVHKFPMWPHVANGTRSESTLSLPTYTWSVRSWTIALIIATFRVWIGPNQSSLISVARSARASAGRVMTDSDVPRLRGDVDGAERPWA